VLLFMCRIPTNTCLLLAVMKESVQYVLRTSPGAVVRFVRDEYNKFVNARDRLVGSNVPNRGSNNRIRARMASPGRVSQGRT
jgi:hypothetical protein